MQPMLKAIVFALVIGVLIFISCKKEYSCENCIGDNQPPIANTWPDQVITLPTDSVSLDGTASSAPDGTITLYKWAKISGPASSNIIKPDSSKTLIKTLVMGVYKFELTVTDNGGLSAYNFHGIPSRSYNSFQDLFDEMINARVYAGIHTRIADIAGVEQERKIAQNIEDKVEFKK